MSAAGTFRPPLTHNEPTRSYAPGSAERDALQARLAEMAAEEVDMPLVIGGRDLRNGRTVPVVMPHDTDHVLGTVHWATPAEMELAVRAADLLAGPWRDTVNGATMLGQSKTAHQAEIDAVCELCDFLRFNVAYAARIYEEQPESSAGAWNRMEYRPLEGFVLAVTPFNFTSIAGNLPASAALMGCTVVWKPSESAAYSGHYLMRLFQAAGLPDGVINLVHGAGAELVPAALAQADLAGVHFTGSTLVFRGIWSQVGENIASYRNYPRLVGETGGKD